MVGALLRTPVLINKTTAELMGSVQCRIEPRYPQRRLTEVREGRDSPDDEWGY